jgi:hypothetical protein
VTVKFPGPHVLLIPGPYIEPSYYSVSRFGRWF